MNKKNESLRIFDELNKIIISISLDEETKQKMKELLDRLESAILLI